MVVGLIAMSILGASGWVLAKAVPLHTARRAHNFFIASVVLGILALISAEALFRLRSHAFLAFTAWSLCAVAAFVLYQIIGQPTSHLLRLFGPLACAGIVYAAIALFLKRTL